MTIFIPGSRFNEEHDILRRFRAGERIENFQIVRRRRNGTLDDISSTVTPVRNDHGKIIGGSKIARDFRAESPACSTGSDPRGDGHRISNLFAVTAGLMRLSASCTTSDDKLARDPEPV